VHENIGLGGIDVVGLCVYVCVYVCVTGAAVLCGAVAAPYTMLVI
jgi:hypothetical protein